MWPPNLLRYLSAGLFVAIWFGMVGGTHFYLWARLVRDTVLAPRPHAWLTTLFATMGIGLPAGLLTLGRMSSASTRVLLGFLYAWMGLIFFGLWWRLAADAVLWAWPRLPWAWPQVSDATSSLWLARHASVAVAALAVLTTLCAFLNTRHGPILEKQTVVLRRLPKSLDGFTLVQLSDLHIAPFLGAAYIQDVVRRTNALQPDAIVITGDLVDGRVPTLGPVVRLLGQLRAPQGVFFITGNHEYYSGVDAWLTFVAGLGIRTLRNERVTLGRGDSSDTFDLAGIDDWTAKKFGHGHGADLPRALAGRDASRELVLLAHQPRTIDEARRAGVGLMLSGHTHGGQIWPFGYFVRMVQPYVRGLHRLGHTQIYVHRGTGYWGPPLRLGSSAEIALLTLRAG